LTTFSDGNVFFEKQKNPLSRDQGDQIIFWKRPKKCDPINCLPRTKICVEKSPKTFVYFCSFQKTFTRPRVENSPNLVTLAVVDTDNEIMLPNLKKSSLRLKSLDRK
jgi:hypothetical protein